MFERSTPLWPDPQPGGRGGPSEAARSRGSDPLSL